MVIDSSAAHSVAVVSVWTKHLDYIIQTRIGKKSSASSSDTAAVARTTKVSATFNFSIIAFVPWLKRNTVDH